MAVGFDSIFSLCLFASAITLIFMGLVYAIGTLLQNPRLTVWVKTEIFQVFVSVVLVMVCLFLVGLIGLSDSGFTVRAGWISEFSGGAESPYGGEGATVFQAAKGYLEHLRDFDLAAVDSSRSAMGAFDGFAKYSKQPCIPGWLFCLLGQNGAQFQPLSGASAQMQAMNLLLYTSLVATITVQAQYILLRYLESGMLAVYLSLAIVLRSLPHMREFGGGLLAICLSLFIVYPSLLFVESAFWDPVVLAGEDSYNKAIAFAQTSDDLSMGNLFFSGGEWTLTKTISVTQHIIRVCAAAFLSSTFLFAFNIVAVAASARAFGRLLGADVDISRLAQIV